jgi:hypothetical protein
MLSDYGEYELAMIELFGDGETDFDPNNDPLPLPAGGNNNEGK